MNKKLIAAAIAAAFVAPSAFGAATLYGKFHTTIDMADAEDDARGTYQDNWEANSRASRIGVKGSEDLGDGLKAIYQLELGFSATGKCDGQPQVPAGACPSNGVFGNNTRNTFVGLAGDWGTALVGRHDTPGKVAFYAGGIEQLGDSLIDMNSGSSLTRGTGISTTSPIGVFHEYRANDAIAYISPSFSGFTFAGAIIPGEDTGADGGGDQIDGLADHWSVGGWYKGGGLRVGAGYTNYEGPAGLGAAAGQKQKVFQVTGAYTFGAFKVAAGYEDTSDDSFVDGADYTAWAVSGKWTFGNNAISAAYTNAERDDPVNGGDDIDKDGWGLTAEHNFSKRTKAYVGYATAENDENGADVDVFSLGMIHKF